MLTSSSIYTRFEELIRGELTNCRFDPKRKSKNYRQLRRCKKDRVQCFPEFSDTDW